MRVGDENNHGELWQLTARGGSGFYHWQIIDKTVATVSGSGLLRSVDQGATTVIVRDTQNQRNTHSIKVEVSPIISLEWLEEHVEVKKDAEVAILSLIAFNKNGKKFTNCSSVDISLELKGVGIVNPIETPKSYDGLT